MKNSPHKSTVSSLEALEDRIAPANFLVTNLANSGLGSLRDAINQSNASTSINDTISFAAGLKGAIHLSAALQISDDVAIAGNGHVTVSGNQSVRIFNITDAAATLINVTLKNLTIAEGAVGTSGAGISSGENLTVKNCTITGNAATAGDGGGIFSTLGNLKVVGSLISGNTATGRGAGIYVGSGTATINKTRFVVNSVTGSGDGGGLWSDAPKVSLTASTFLGNTSDADGGGFALTGAVDTVVKLTSCKITGNIAASDGGGGYIGSNVEAKISKTTFSGNRSGATGGGLVIPGVSNEITIQQSKFLDNVARGRGAGIFTSANSFKLVASTIAHNSAVEVGSNGGGIFINDGIAKITGGSITSNYAFGSGGGIYNDSPTAADLNGVAVSSNSALTDPDLHGSFV